MNDLGLKINVLLTSRNPTWQFTSIADFKAINFLSIISRQPYQIVNLYFICMPYKKYQIFVVLWNILRLLMPRAVLNIGISQGALQPIPFQLVGLVQLMLLLPHQLRTAGHHRKFLEMMALTLPSVRG